MSTTPFRELDAPCIDPNITNDPFFYLEDGDTIFLVENVLFRVQRRILDKPLTTFSDFFLLRDINEATTGIPSSPHPVQVIGENVGQFRALMWALHSPPEQVFTKITNGDEEVATSMTLAAAAFFHRFEDIVVRTLELLYDHQKSLLNRDYELTTVNLPSLTYLAMQCGHNELLNVTIASWKKLFIQDYPGAIALGLRVGELLDLPDVLGCAYYYMTLKGPIAWYSDPSLTREQQNRLVYGFNRLAKVREELPSRPPLLRHHPSCKDIERCDLAWSELWKGTVEAVSGGVPTANLADTLWKAHNELPDLELLVGDPETCEQNLDEIGMHPPCLENVWAAGVDKFNEACDGRHLIKYFS